MSRKDLANDVWRAADIMRRDDGTNGINEYIEQISWMFFLKVFEDLENRFDAEHALQGKTYDRIIPKKYSWSQWTKIGSREIIRFIDNELFPSLGSLSGTPERNIIAQIFSEVQRNKMKSASNLMDVIDIVNEIDFNNSDDSHILSQFYEDLLVKLGKESGIAGEFYTPRPVVRLMVKMIDPKISVKNEKFVRMLDPFCGSCGFLVEAYKHIINNEKITAKNYLYLQGNFFHGYEKKSLPYLVGVMNCILHSLLTPNVLRKNSLNENIINFGSDDKFDYVLTNPPFGGTESKQVQQNFPVRSQATELLALQQVMKRLKPDGQCGIIVPEGLLYGAGSFTKVKKELLENFNLHTIISLPPGVFANVTSSGSGPKANILLFNKNGKTNDIWYYELESSSGKKYSKMNTVTDSDLDDCYDKWKNKTVSSRSWIVKHTEIIKRNYDLSARKDTPPQEANKVDPIQILDELIIMENNFRKNLFQLKDIMSKFKK